MRDIKNQLEAMFADNSSYLNTKRRLEVKRELRLLIAKLQKTEGALDESMSVTQTLEMFSATKQAVQKTMTTITNTEIGIIGGLLGKIQ